MTEALRDYEDLTPCGDGNCIMLTAPATGQHTNGGCQHLKLDAVPTRRLLRLVAADRRRFAEAARAVVLAEASLASCVIHGAPRDVMRAHRDEWQRALGALRDLLAVKS